MANQIERSNALFGFVGAILGALTTIVVGAFFVGGQWVKWVEIRDLHAKGVLVNGDMPTPIDTSKFATNSQIPDVSTFVSKNEIPNFDEFARLDDIPAPIDLSNYARKSDIPNLDGYAKIADLSALPDFSGYALKSDIPDISGYLKSGDRITLQGVSTKYLYDYDARNTDELDVLMGAAQEWRIRRAN